MRMQLPALVLCASLVMVGCAEPASPDESAIIDAAEANVSDQIEPTILSADNQTGTPLEERVATLGILNKRNNVSQDVQLGPGQTERLGDVEVTLQSCERTAPWELRKETGAFVQVSVRGRGEDDYSRIFSGWLFKNSPSINVVEHPIYDVWVKDCAMSFPGEE